MFGKIIWYIIEPGHYTNNEKAFPTTKIRTQILQRTLLDWICTISHSSICFHVAKRSLCHLQGSRFGMNKNGTSFTEDSLLATRYLKDNFNRLVRIKTKLIPIVSSAMSRASQLFLQRIRKEGRDWFTENACCLSKLIREYIIMFLEYFLFIG